MSETPNVHFGTDEGYTGLRRVLTYGTFDLLHYGHIRLLRRAAELGDYLVVALSTDEFNASKGKQSFYSYGVRKEMLEGHGRRLGRQPPLRLPQGPLQPRVPGPHGWHLYHGREEGAQELGSPTRKDLPDQQEVGRTTSEEDGASRLRRPWRPVSCPLRTQAYGKV